MTLVIPVKLKMSLNPFKQVQTCPQNIDSDENALDKVVDALTEFNVSSEEENKSPKKSYDLERKSSSTSLYTKLEYFVDRNELPRVHRSPSSQSLLSEKFSPRRNLANNHHNHLNPIQDNNLSSSIDNFSIRSDLSLNGSKTILEKFETGSNNSFNSTLTDIQSSFISSVSDFDDQKISCEFESTIRDLKTKLGEREIENNQLKFELKDIEWKTELRWQEKYQETLRQNANLEGQLKTVQNQYESLIKERERMQNEQKPEKSNILKEYTEIQSKLNNYEKTNSELVSKLILATNECTQRQKQNSDLEFENESLRISVQELKIEVDSKNSVLQSLKNKITEQHIEVQNEIQAKLKLSNQISTLNNEIESLKKSEKWYSDQLHACQLQKNKIQQELMTAQSNLVAHATKIDKLKSELVHFRNVAEETKVKAIKEKEKLVKRMEVIEADLIERQMFNTDKNNSECQSFISDNKVPEHLQNGADNTYENETEQKLLLEESQEKISTLTRVIFEKDELITQLNKQGAEFLVRVTTLQKFLNEKELHVQTLENLVKDLQMKCSSLKDNLNKKETLIFELKNKIVNFEVQLHASKAEKNEIDATVKTIREDFNKFMKVYNNMKIKLEEKSKIINNFESEKQEIFMENNWRVCEIEELQQKILCGKISQAEFLELKNQFNDLVIEKEKILAENANLKSQLDELQNVAQNVDISTLQEALKTREIFNQLFNQTENCDLLNKDIAEKDLEIEKLKTEIESYDLQLYNANFKTSELRDINLTLETKIQELYKKIRDCNFVIDQFNTLCRSAELEKHDLATKLASIKTEHFNFAPKDFSEQTDMFDFQNNLKNIKGILNDIIFDTNQNFDFDPDLENLSCDNFFEKIQRFFMVFVKIRNEQSVALELNEKLIKSLKNKVNLLKCGVTEKILKIQEKLSRISEKVNGNGQELILVKDLIGNKLGQVCVKSVQTEEDLVKNEGEGEESLVKNKNKHDKTNRTLLRKLKDELKSRKTAEKNLHSLQETYNLALNEINNLKIEKNRINLEVETLKTRCNEYKEICDRQNESILLFEKEKGANESKENMECQNCLELNKLKNDYYELDCRFESMKEKIVWYEKEISDKEKGITECKKQLFNEKIQSSSLKKQVSSIQMCLDNANSLLDTKQVELNQMKLVVEKLEKRQIELSELLDLEQANCQETKQKLDETLRLLEEKMAKDEILGDEIKTISCHLHQKNLKLTNSENKIVILQEEHSKKVSSLEKRITELENNVAETQFELEGVQNDKFFLQRLCADLKTSLQGTINQNKVLQESLNSLQKDTNNKLDGLPFLNKIDDEYICKLLKESTVSPEKPLLNLRSCLDSLKKEMAILQSEIIAKTQNN